MSDDGATGSQDGGFVVQVVIVGLMVFAVALTSAVVTDASPGSIPDWIAAISTFAAFVAAIVAARYAAGAFRIQADAEADRRFSEKREQASLVAAWLAGMDPVYIKLRDGTQQVTDVRVQIAIQNSSRLPVQNVTFIIAARPEQPGRSLLPAGDDIRILPDVVWNVLRPQPDPVVLDDHFPQLAEWAREWATDGGNAFPLVCAVEIEFADAAGRTWRRHTDGQLELIAESFDDLLRQKDA